MKTAFVLLLLTLFGFSSCNQKPSIDQATSEREIEKRVQERLESERRAEHERQLEEREKQLSAKEKSLQERERDAERAQTETTAMAEPEHSEPAEPPTSERPQTAESYNVFYDALDRDGDWIETDKYGYVWVPEIARRDPAWRPYTIGHWAYTDEGWTWVSNERFGWAVYHYGRWARLRDLGWAWVPGEEWAPAWVAWRSSDEFVGWAALPPEATFERDTGIGDWADNRYEISPAQYVFVNIVNFSAPVVNQVLIEPGRNSAIIGRTRNVTRITSDRSRIINNGPRLDLLRTRTQRPIEQLRIDRRGDTRQTATVRGGALEISAPIIKKPDRNLKPRRVKERVAEAIVERAPQPNGSVSQATATPTPVPPPNTKPLRAQEESQKALQQENAQTREAARVKKQQEEAAEQQRLRQEQAQQLEKAGREQDAIKAQQAEQIRRAEALKAQQLQLAEEQKKRELQNADAAAKRDADLKKQQEAIADQQRRLQEQLKAQQLQQSEQMQKVRETAERQQADALKAQQLQQASQQQNAANAQAEEKKRLQLQAAEERQRAQQEAIEQRKQQLDQVRQAREEAIRQRQSAVEKQPPQSAPERARGNRPKPADAKKDDSPTPAP